MVEGRCQYSLQWRVSGRLKEQGELNNAQYIEWEKILVDYCGLFGLQNGGIYGRSSLFNVDRLKEKVSKHRFSYIRSKNMHIHSIVFVRYSSIGFEVIRLICIP